MTCTGTRHVFTEPGGFGSAPFCECGVRRNPAYHRSMWQKLRGRPKRGP